ncbi:MAG: helix-turn-helix domain-containing protein [bacterium]
MIKKDWLWDKDLDEKEIEKILSDKENPQFVSLVSLLLSRKNSAQEVFKDYLKREDFYTFWPKIKKQMRKNSWNDQRIEYWQAIYETLKKVPDLAELKPVKFDEPLFSLCKEIGTKIKEAREKVGLTQKDMAERLNISQQIISRIEKGRQNISLETLNNVCKSLGISLNAENFGFKAIEKPEVTSTRHILPFGSLPSDRFSHLCFDIIDSSAGFDKTEFYDGTGDKGRDVIGYKYNKVGKPEKWYFQCKRYDRISFKDFKEEIDKLKNYSDKEEDFRPEVIVFMVGCPVSPSCKDKTKKYATGQSFESIEIWDEVKLNVKVSSDKIIREEYFGNEITSKDQEKTIKKINRHNKFPEDKKIWRMKVIDETGKLTEEFKSFMQSQGKWYRELINNFREEPLISYSLEDLLGRPYAEILSLQNDPEFIFEFTDPNEPFQKEITENLDKAERIVFDYASLLNLSKMNLLDHLEKLGKQLFITQELFKKIQDELLIFEQEDLRRLWRFLCTSKEINIIEEAKGEVENHEIFNIFDKWITESIRLAKGNDAVFITDDLRFLRFLRSEKVKGCNSLIILKSMLARQWIDNKIYSLSIGDLAERCYTFLSYTGDDLFQIVMEDHSKITLRSYHLVNQLFLPGSIITSFTAVFVRFIDLLWQAGSLPEDKVQWLKFITDAVLKFVDKQGEIENDKEFEVLVPSFTQMWIIAVQKSNKDTISLLEKEASLILDRTYLEVFRDNIIKFITLKKESLGLKVENNTLHG